MSKRLFLGLELPESIRTELAALDPGIRGARWVPEESMHLTLSFVGEVNRGAESNLREALGEAKLPGAFFLPVKGVGVFGGDWPRVLWAGVGTGHPHLFSMHQHLQDALLQAGLVPDLKPFQPHITLARLRDVSRASLKRLLRDHAETEFGLWKVSEVVLYSSVLSEDRAAYIPEVRRALPEGTGGWKSDSRIPD